MYTIEKKSSLICILFLLFLSNLQLVEAQNIPSAQFANAVRTLHPTLVDANSNTFTSEAASYSGILDLSGWGNATKSDGTASEFAGQTKLTSIEGIGYLAQLRGLDISNQALNTIPIVANSVLFIQATNNQLSSLPTILPTSLEYLRISHNKVTQLPELPINLKALKCDNNQLYSLPNLPNNLAYLDVSFNKELACLPTVPNNLANTSLPSSILTTYAFSSDAKRRIDFSNTAVRCIPNFYTNAWAAGITNPLAPGICSEVPVLKSSLKGSDSLLSSGTIVVAGILPSANAKVEYSIAGGIYTKTSYFTDLAAGNYTIQARRKSESTSCLNPSSSVTIAVPTKSNQDIYVSPSGHDILGTGTKENPFRTISKGLSSTSVGSNAVIRLSDGVFIETQQLNVPSSVSIIGSGSGKTFVRVDVYSEYSHMIQLLGGFSDLKGFSMEGQAKKCYGAIIGEFANNCSIEDLNIQNFKHSAIIIKFADNTTIQNCFIKNCTFGTIEGDNACIFLDGENILLKQNTLILNEDIGGYGIKDTFPISQYVQFFQIPDLRREDEYALNITMEDNTILVNPTGMWNNRQAPGFVFESFATCKNCIFRNNIFNGTLSLVDGGSTSYGYFYDGVRYTIHNNTFNLFDGGNSVESGSPQIEFHHNYVFGGGGLNSFGGNSNDLNYHHNVFYGQTGLYPISSWQVPPLNFKFNNNTVIDHRGKSIWIGTNGMNRNIEVKNNIFASLSPSISNPPANTFNQLEGKNTVISNNLYYNITPYGQNNIIMDPKLLLSGIKPFTYFQLRKNSPAIDAGLIITGTTDDYKGNAPDLGAYETDNIMPLSTNLLSFGTDNPESGAAVDILSNSQGLLIPRLPLSTIQNIPSPAEGLLVFCSDCTPKSFFYSDGEHWLKQTGGNISTSINLQLNTSSSIGAINTITPDGSAAFEISSNTKGLLLPRVTFLSDVRNPTEGLLVYLKNIQMKGIYFYDGKKWQRAIRADTAFKVNFQAPGAVLEGIGINTYYPHPSAVLDIQSTNKGLLPPRLGKTQMEAIKSPALGLLLYCYDCPTKGYYYNNGTHWQGTTITVPSEPLQNKAIPNGTSVEVSFSPPAFDGNSPITSYRIISKPGDIIVSTSSHTANFTDLLPSVPYVFLVSAINKEGASTAGVSNPVIINVPDAPTNPYAIRGLQEGSSEIYFTPPTYTGNSEIINYTVTQIPTNRSFTTNQSPFVVTGLNLNTTYSFTIRANNSTGSSLPALTNSVTADIAIVSTPRVLDNTHEIPAVAFGLRHLKSSYQGPAIDVRRESDNQIISIGFDNTGSLNIGLLADFCGTSKGYISKWYDQSGKNKHATNSNYEGQPLIYNGLSIENLNGKPAARFMGSSTLLRTNQNVLINSNELTTLTIAYAFYYQTIVQHGNGGGEGHFFARREFANYGFGINWNSISENIYVENHTQPIFSILTCRNSVLENRRHLRRNGANSVSMNTSIRLNFTNDILTLGGSFSGHLAEHIAYNSYVTLQELENMENNQSNYYTISSPCLANSIPPSPLTQVFAASITSTSANISFVPGSSGSRPLNYYEVISSSGNIRATGSGSPITINGLTAGQTYQFSVSAVNFCDEKSIATASNTLVSGQISAPSNITAQKGSAEGSAVVSFNMPTFTNSQPITGYTVTSIPDNLIATANSTSITVTGLSDIKKYSFQVVANTTSSSSLPSLPSNSVYAHTQILADLPAPSAAFALRKLRSAYNGPAVRVRRGADNTFQDIGFLPNGELNEEELLTFVGNGDGFVSTWYDQSGNNRNLSQVVWPEQPKIVGNGVIARKNNQPTLQFYTSNKLIISTNLENTRAFHSVWHANGSLGRWGSLLRFNPNLGNGGIYFTDNGTRLTKSNNWYASEIIFVNGVQTNEFAPLNQLKTVTTETTNHAMPASVTGFRLGEDLDYYGNGFGSISTFMMFSNNLSATERTKLDQREAACFEITLP